MKAEELKIGNYVQIIESGNVFQIEAHHYSGEAIDYFSPIPLTEEWLKKIGFEKEGEERVLHGTLWKDISIYTLDNFVFSEELKIKAGHNEMGDENYIYPQECKYVHQLQNLYFALTGEELNLKEA